MMTIHPPILTAIACAFLGACGGSGSGSDSNSAVLVPAPAAPSAQETAEFQARKVVSSRASGALTPLLFSAGGHNLLEYTNDSRGGVFKNDARSLPQGFTTLSGESRSSVYTPYPTREAETLRSYQGFRSGVFMFYRDSNLDANSVTYGDYTSPAQLPTAGKATYSGTAFDRHSQGTLTYHVDFGAKTGQGTIEGLNAYGTISLAQGKIETVRNELEGTYMQITGIGTAARGQQMYYLVDFFGNQAEEIAGVAYTDDTKNSVGFHGTRGAITE